MYYGNRIRSLITPVQPSVGHDGLSEFVIQNLINRPGTYAMCEPNTDRSEEQLHIVNGLVTKDIVKKSLCAADQTDLIALPTTSIEKTSRFVVIDIRPRESDSKTTSDDPEVAARRINDKLHVIGFGSFTVRFKNYNRFQIWIVFNKPIPAEDAHRFGQAIVDRTVALALTCRLDVYPKLQNVAPQGIGNFVSLPCLNPDNIDCSELWEPYDDDDDDDDDECVEQDYYYISVNDPELVTLDNFVPDPVMTAGEFAARPVVVAEKPIDRVLSRVKGVQACRQGHRGCCPGHEDYFRSLLISEDDEGNILLHCCEGCTFEAILRALDPVARYVLQHVHRPGVMETELFCSADWLYHRLGIRYMSTYIALRPFTTRVQIEILADALQVSPESLEDLEVACCQIGRGCSFPLRDGAGRLRGTQVYNDLAEAISLGQPKDSRGHGENGLIIPRSFDLNKPEIVIVDGAINTAAGLSLGWNVIGCGRGGECVSAAIECLKFATSDIRILGYYCPMTDEEASNTSVSDPVTPAANLATDSVEWGCEDMEYEDSLLEAAHGQARAYSSMLRKFAELLQRGVTAPVSIMDAPSEFREIRLAAYLKSQLK